MSANHTAETVAAAIAFTSFANEREFRALTANEQRSIFGAVPFGRKQVRHSAHEGGVLVLGWTISRDINIQCVSYAKIARALNEGKAVEIQR